MSGDLALLGDPDAIDRAADPGTFVVLACERAKAWLTQAVEQGEIDQIVELKSQAEAIRIYTAQKQLGKDAELAAAEIVRRAERGLGIAVRRGQAEGVIRDSLSGNSIGGRIAHGQVRPDDMDLPRSALDYFGGHHERTDSYVMADIPDEDFEEVIEDAKAEQNLSRANIVRKVKVGHAKNRQSVEDRVERIRSLTESGHTASQIAEALGIGVRYVRELANTNGVMLTDAVLGKRRRIDPDRVMRESVTTLEGVVMGLSLIAEDLDQLDPCQVAEWAASFGASVRFLSRFRKQLEEMAHG